MAKVSGLGFSSVAVDLANGTTPTEIKNDVNNLQWSTPRGVQDITGVDKSAYERLLLLADFSVTLNGIFNLGLSHTVFSTIVSGTTDRTTTLTVASATMTAETLYTDYQITRAASGELTWSAPGVLSGGTAPAWT